MSRGGIGRGSGWRMRRGPILLAALVALVLLAASIGGWVFVAAEHDSGAASVGGPFTLIASGGRVVTDRDFRGKWMLVYFGYTTCPDVCPAALNNIANALDRLGARRRDVAPLFITVDPEHDTPDVIGRYVALFDRQIVGLTGTPAQIDEVARHYRVYAARHPGKDGSYTVDHSSILYVMDKSGRFNSALDGDATPAEIAARLEKLDS